MGGAALGLNHVALWSKVLGLWVEQLTSAPDALPPEVSCVGPQFANLHARNRASGECREAYPAFTVQGRREEGRQEPRLLPRVLYVAPECLYFLFPFEKFFLFKPPWSKQAPGCSQVSLALSQESCSRPCTWARASATLVPVRVPGPGDLIVLKHSSYRQIF